MNLHRSLKITVWFLTVVFFFGCAAKAPRTPTPDYGPKPAPVYQVPIGPPQPAPPTSDVPGPKPVENPSPVPAPEESRKVTLVLGGAGVASFATVGILKKFQEEGVAIEVLIASGWPALFAVGSGFSKSIHDLDWFASRLTDKDFHAASSYAKDNSSINDHINGRIGSTYSQSDLLETKVPVAISESNSEFGLTEVIDRGDWKLPLVTTMSLPGLYRQFIEPAVDWPHSLRGMDVQEAKRRGARIIIAVDMYTDYLEALKANKDAKDKVLRKQFASELRRALAKEAKEANISTRIVLGRSPVDFAARRAAIVAGYKEAARLIKQIR